MIVWTWLGMGCRKCMRVCVCTCMCMCVGVCWKGEGLSGQVANSPCLQSVGSSL